MRRGDGSLCLNLHFVNHTGGVHDAACGGQGPKAHSFGRGDPGKCDLQAICLNLGPCHTFVIQRITHADFGVFFDQLHRKIGRHQRHDRCRSKRKGDGQEGGQAHAVTSVLLKLVFDTQVRQWVQSKQEGCGEKQQRDHAGIAIGKKQLVALCRIVDV